MHLPLLCIRTLINDHIINYSFIGETLSSMSGHSPTACVLAAATAALPLSFLGK